ncbi:Nucleolar Pre-Ribosomal-Associated Protein 1 [Manis pentadactyla]|nr:Nucleolar Pre-Ribosomal-Associated Protein 1 [Manis pentadactyla]
MLSKLFKVCDLGPFDQLGLAIADEKLDLWGFQAWCEFRKEKNIRTYLQADAGMRRRNQRLRGPQSTGSDFQASTDPHEGPAPRLGAVRPELRKRGAADLFRVNFRVRGTQFSDPVPGLRCLPSGRLSQNGRAGPTRAEPRGPLRPDHDRGRMMRPCLSRCSRRRRRRRPGGAAEPGDPARASDPVTQASMHIKILKKRRKMSK